MSNKKLVSILVPCYNEEQSLPHLYKAIVEMMDQENQYNRELSLSPPSTSISTIFHK